MRHHQRIKAGLWVVVMLFLAGVACAQDVAPAPLGPVPAPEEPAVDQKAPGPAATAAAPANDAPAPVDESPVRKMEILDAGSGRTGLEMRVSINVRDMNLAQAARLLAEQAGVNIAIGKDVAGKVTCSLKDVSTRAALEAMLHSNGYTFADRDGVLIVIKQGEEKKFDKAATSPKIVRNTFHLPYTGTEKEFVAGSTQPQPATKAAQSTVETIKEMLSPRGRMVHYERQHIIVVEDYESSVAMIEEFVKQLWKVPAQVFISSKLIEVTLEDEESLGLRWDIIQEVGAAKGGTDLTTVAQTMGLDKPFTFGLVNADIEAVLEALASRKRVNLVSNPNVMVMNHRMASIVVGQEIPYLSSEESTGGNPIRTYEFKEVAVRLDVTPHIGEDGMVFLDVHPSVKSVIGETEDPKQPILSTREAVTNVAVMDGTTLIIGGLVQRNVTNSRKEIPWFGRALGWIPILGIPFRQKTESDTKNDLIFLLTPRIVKPEMMQQMMNSKKHLLKELPEHPGEDPKPHPVETYIREKLSWERREE